MAHVEKTPAEVLKPLAPTPAQRLAWQLLGYQRYLHRSALPASPAEQFEAQIEARRQPAALTIPAVQLVPEIVAAPPAAPAKPAEPAVQHPKAEAQLYRQGGVSIAALAGCTLLCSKDAALCLPALWPAADGRYYCFAQEQERRLLEQAFSVMEMPAHAALLHTLPEEGMDAPQGQELPAALHLPAGRPLLVLGVFDALQTALQKLFRQELPLLLPCTHPAPALASGTAKRRLWLDLLTIKETLK